jgi:hypothetical protein
VKTRSGIENRGGQFEVVRHNEVNQSSPYISEINSRNPAASAAESWVILRVRRARLSRRIWSMAFSAARPVYRTCSEAGAAPC